MADLQDLKRRMVHGMQRLVVNPVGRQLPVTMLEPPDVSRDGHGAPPSEER